MTDEHQATTDDGRGRTDYIWLLSCALVTATAIFLRFFWLDLKPLHHDEGVNGHFLTSLFREGLYKYDPANYHGPTLYYISLAFSKTFGLNTWSVRSSVAVFGVLIVILAYFLKNYIGRTGSLFAALFLALSPGMVYISRYFIHEIFFVFCSLAIVVSIVYFIERRKAGVFAIGWTSLLLLICFLPSALNLANVLGGQNETLLWSLRGVFFLVEAVLVFVVMRMLLAWNDGQAIYLILASASAVLFFATKETAFITLGTMAIACFSVWLWRKINSSDSFAKNKFWVFLAPIVLFPLAVLLDRSRFAEAHQILSDFFTVEGGDHHRLVFYSIIFLAALALVAWLVFLLINRRGGEAESSLTEPTDLTWSHFRGKSSARDNWEVVLFSSLIGSATILTLWLFQRVIIDLMNGWKAGRSVSSVWEKIALSNVDYSILAIALILWAVFAGVWKFRRPEKISVDFLLLSVAVTVTFLYVGTLFFSSFFTYPEGVKGAFEAYAIWTKTGNTDHTQNGFWAYLKWGAQLEAPILILSLLGFAIALFKARHRFALFAGFWAFGLFAAYTIIPYKTPWLALSFLLPMCISAGYAVNELLDAVNDLRLRIVGGALAALAAGILAFQTYDVNFVRYDSDRMPYIYAHTKREYLELIRQIEYYAEKSGRGREATIEIVSPDYWPMPWYLNDYKAANFHGRLVDSETAEMIVAKKEDQDAEVTTRYGENYKYAGTYPLRPGVDLMLLVRNDLADSDAREIYSVIGEPLLVSPDEEPEEEEEKDKTPR